MQVAIYLYKLCLNVTKSKYMLFHMPHRVTPLMYFKLNRSPIEYIHEFNFLGRILDGSLSFMFYLTKNRISNFKSPLAHTESILKGMDQLIPPIIYTCHLIKLYYKLYRNKLLTYFENFLSE